MRKQNVKKLNPKANSINTLLLMLLLIATFFLGVLTNQLAGSTKMKSETTEPVQKASEKGFDLTKLEAKVISDKGYRFSISWGDLGKKLVDEEVIDEVKLAQSLTGSETMPDEVKKYLDGSDQKIELNEQNAHFWLNVLWGLGLANKNKILDEGDMQELSENNPGNFASTGGYTLGKGDAMSYYSKYSYIKLDDKQQKLVEEIAGNIYRPCCGNSTAFPDCNHGMAMLALVELMVSQNYSKEKIYDTALKFNSLWFPQTYFDIAYHFEKAGRDYNKIASSELLSKTFSSAQGYEVIRKEAEGLQWPGQKSGGGCGA